MMIMSELFVYIHYFSRRLVYKRSCFVVVQKTKFKKVVDARMASNHFVKKSESVNMLVESIFMYLHQGNAKGTQHPINFRKSDNWHSARVLTFYEFYAVVN